MARRRLPGVGDADGAVLGLPKCVEAYSVV